MKDATGPHTRRPMDMLATHLGAHPGVGQGHLPPHWLEVLLGIKVPEHTGDMRSSVACCTTHACMADAAPAPAHAAQAEPLTRRVWCHSPAYSRLALI